MARSGIYKAEVLRARNALAAAGRHPSIDAVREKLGHTGSKSTIHRFLKEIEEEEGPKAEAPLSISEALQDLVSRLAQQLNEEAQTQITRAQQAHAAQLSQHQQESEALRTQAQSTQQVLKQTSGFLDAEKTAHARTSQALNVKILEWTQLTQQVTDLQAQLEALEKHRLSLEDKHQHARLALDHFRETSQAQRTQDQRRHEQQVQYLQSECRSLNENLAGKQQELAQANQENVRLSGDLSHSQSDALRLQDEVLALHPLKDMLQQSQRQADSRAQQLDELLQVQQKTETSAQAMQQKIQELNAHLQQSELKQAALQSALSVQEHMVSSLLAKLTVPKAPEMTNALSPADPR